MVANMFSRQISLLGKTNQDLIKSAKIGILGLGGLGSVAAHLLVRMGFENFVFVDFDDVANHNLSRQHLYIQSDIGNNKAECAKRHAENINPNIKVTTSTSKISNVEDLDIFDGVDIIFDGLDNHQTRRLLDTYCKKKNSPWVHGAAIQERGTVIFFDKDTKYSSIYSLEATDTHCEALGVLATTTTTIATIQTQLILNYILKRPIKKEIIRIDLNKVSLETYKIN